MRIVSIWHRLGRICKASWYVLHSSGENEININARDTEERNRALEALRLSEEKFSKAFLASPDAISINKLKDGTFIEINEGFTKLTGHTKNDVIGKSSLDVNLWAIGNDRKRFVRELTRHREVSDFEAEFLTKDGSKRTGLVSGKLMNVRNELWILTITRDITERKRAEEQLHLQKAYFQQLFESAPEAIVLLRTDERIIQVNREFTKFFGYMQEEAVDRQINDLIVPEMYKEEGLTLSRRVAQGSIISTESIRRRKDGTHVDVSILGRPVLVDGGQIAIYAIYRDITDRKQVEEQLRESEERLRLALTGANMMSWELDLRTGKVTWSVDAETFYGLKPNEFAGTRDAFVQLIHPDDRSVVELSMNDSIQQGKEFKSEFRIMWPDGTVHWHAAYGRASRDEQGRPVKVSGIGADITDRKRSEETIQKLHHAVEQTDEVIFMTEPDGVITYVNPAFEKLYRYSREEVIGKTPRVLKSGGMSQDYYTQLWRDLLAGKSIRAEHINKTKDGKIVIVEASVNSIYDVKGRLTGFIAVQEDISDRKRNEAERKRLEAQLLQTQKLESIGTLAGGIAHDFNNILGIILAYSSSLRNARLPFEKVVSAADIINQAVERGAELVKQILTFARKTDVVYGLVNINVMIKELRKMLSETFPRTISIATELGGDVPEITADATQVHQAILNICVNARDAMPAGGMMVLRTKSGTRSEVSSYFPEATSARYVRVSIADTGSGMDENTRQRIFEPFFTTKAKGKGTGLGLSVVYGVVKNHNGFVRVDSEIGRGTTFHLYFPAPLQSAQPVETKQGSLVDIPGGTESILVVEDEEPLLNVLSGLLKSKGYRVFIAHDGFEAVETYEQHHNDIAVVVSDLGLPRMTGQDAFLRMKSVNPKVKVIFGTGYLDPDLKSELLNLGAKGFLAKPYSQDELLMRIRELIDLDQ
jgi:PAS domain S-box-containing protein